MISSPLMTGSYERTVPDYTAHNDRELPPVEPAEQGDQNDAADWAALDSNLDSLP